MPTPTPRAFTAGVTITPSLRDASNGKPIPGIDTLKAATLTAGTAWCWRLSKRASTKVS
jgi:hypothetical protein